MVDTITAAMFAFFTSWNIFITVWNKENSIFKQVDRNADNTMLSVNQIFTYKD